MHNNNSPIYWFSNQTKNQIINYATSREDLLDKLSKVWSPYNSYTASVVNANDYSNNDNNNDYSWCDLSPLLTISNDIHNNPNNLTTTLNNSNNNHTGLINGLLFVKLYKAASSTGAGITLQIAKNVASRHFHSSFIPCPSYQKHGTTIFTNRTTPNFIWTIIRDPAQRSISHYFFHFLGRMKNRPSDGLLEHVMNQQKMIQLNYLSTGNTQSNITTHLNQSKNITAIEQHVINVIQNQIMTMYHFVAIVERMDESLVVLKMLLHLQDEDIIVLSSKQSGGYDDGKFNDKCNYIPKSNTTPIIDEYIQNEYKQQNGDYLLYEIMNKSLDKTIDSLGRQQVQDGVYQYRKLKEIATKYCASKAIYPCSDQGIKQPESASNCLFGDAGCAYECVANVLKEYRQGKFH